MSKHSMRAKWNTANARLANKPFDDLFAEKPKKGVSMTYYQILQRTPFSIQYYPSEPYQPIAEYQLQMAEHDLKLNKTHYYERAVKAANGVLLYPREIAERVVAYWKKRWTFADYQLIATTPGGEPNG